MINIFQPSLGHEEIRALNKLFETNWVGKGKKTDEFIQAFSDKIGSESDHMLTLNSCSEGIFQVLEFMQFKIDDEIIIPSISFVASANATIDCGLVPIFCDVDKRTLNARASDIEKCITNRTKAVLLLNYGGYPVEYSEINLLLKKYDLKLIIDNACSPFSTYNGMNTGLWGDFGIWSFDAMKILVTGDGGMVYAKNTEHKRAIEMRSYLGQTTPSGYASKGSKIWWEFDIDHHGRRSITNDIASTIGLVQLKKIDTFLIKRKRVHEFYNNELAQFEEFELPSPVPANCETSYYFYWIRLPSQKHRDSLAKYLKKNDVYTTFRYYPLHLIKYYKNVRKLKNSEDAVKRVLCLPIHQALSKSDLAKIVDLIYSWKRNI
jgi:aminotransferase|tara:strand:+ start:111 stop:1241 length:1131 start_codon:yes stop_codon:yes gene_type:complete